MSDDMFLYHILFDCTSNRSKSPMTREDSKQEERRYFSPNLKQSVIEAACSSQVSPAIIIVNVPSCTLSTPLAANKPTIIL